MQEKNAWQGAPAVRTLNNLQSRGSKVLGASYPVEILQTLLSYLGAQLQTCTAIDILKQMLFFESICWKNMIATSVF